MKNDLLSFVADTLSGFREDLQGMENILELGPVVKAAVERLERRIPREEATRIVKEVLNAQRD